MIRPSLLYSLFLLPAACMSDAQFYNEAGDTGGAPSQRDTGSNDEGDDTGDAGWEDEEGFPMLTPAATDVYVFV
ncbi:MAG: hypothetical protein JXB39_14680, partial [Deltaproteobacteria bacterium]|nr:hypothetical protein [Deltaproteobacteria bacterium]